ncbi:hypothetical protein [Allobranchiibius sp. CTAmp26]|uniref:hypothetical protein n=1 Tax=Allobranchiibius sp. CTAmp26 TaxID=2815214 RepID=UPI001AA15DDE|nr:hypothetical protein [Allobranchiibius sp. CTAmp26]MBO1754227.1 hypothetical protein [Allobranchiibius sp. CTAmp26]
MTTLLAARGVARARTDWRGLAGRRLLPLTVLGYLLCRTFSAVLMIWLARHQPVDGVPGGVPGGHATYWDETRMWDGRWYQEIAGHGYPRHLPVNPDGKVAQNAWAFLPLYPLAVKCLVVVTGASFAVAGSLLSLVLGGAAVAVMAVLLRDRIGAPAALASVIVFSALPPSITLQMTYTESLALLILMGFLLALERDRWMIAALLALTMGLTRPIAAPMVLVVLAVAVARWRERAIRPVRRRDWGGMAAVAGAGLVGALLWAQIAGRVTGVRSAYFETQGAWRADGVVFFQPWVRNFELLFGKVGATVVLVALLATFVAMVTGPWARALGPVLLGWTVAYAAYLVATVDVWTSTYRYAMFLFPLVPVALGVGWVHRERRVLVTLRCAIFLVLSLGWQVWWAWTLLRFVPPVGNPI